ncbi:hypothetical protein SCHPADRAFT_947139 [Schizopora paradoxa]|uniref:Uncharacterized protein n=1 Tax=Schizopora paradoxa TaxID=27342 RepID=A0A0H2RK55_9AGAM|nr:hypothetical protein SCHPADRAFT_947139 [Schizopora paradoxa]
MRRPRPLACPLFCIKIPVCQWGLPPSSAHAPLKSPLILVPVSTWDSSIFSSSLSRDHTSLQSGVVGSTTGGGGLHSCLARARARALRRGFAGLVTNRYERDQCLRPSPHARPLFCIQIRDVPVVPSTGGGLAAILNSSDIEIGRVVGNARTAYVFIVEVQDLRQLRSTLQSWRFE